MHETFAPERVQYVYAVSPRGTTPPLIQEVLQRLHPRASIVSVAASVSSSAQLARIVYGYSIGVVYFIGGRPTAEFHSVRRHFGWVTTPGPRRLSVVVWDGIAEQTVMSASHATLRTEMSAPRS